MTIKSAETALLAVKALRGCTLNGKSLREIAKLIDESPSQACRYMQALMNQGFAKQDENGLYYLSVAFAQFATEHQKEITTAQARIDEIKRLTF